MIKHPRSLSPLKKGYDYFKVKHESNYGVLLMLFGNCWSVLIVKNGDHSNIFKETKSLNNFHSPNIDHQRLVNIGIAPLLRCLHGSPSIHMAGNAACWRAGFSYASCCGKPGDEGAKDVVSKQDKIWIWS